MKRIRTWKPTTSWGSTDTPVMNSSDSDNSIPSDEGVNVPNPNIPLLIINTTNASGYERVSR